MIVCRECGRRNPDGTTFCENRDCGAFLEWSGEDLPTEADPVVKDARGPGWGATGPRPTGPSEVGLTVHLPERELSVAPGASTTCDVTVRNTGLIVDQYAIQVMGPAASWVSVEPPSVNLVPQAEGSARLTFQPPRRPDVFAGLTPFRLVATSHQNPQATTFADGTVTVAPFHELATQIRQPTGSGRQANYEVYLENRGNAPVVARVEAADDRHALDIRLSAPTIMLRPGGRGTIGVTVRPRERTLSGGPATYPFRVVAHSDRDPPRSMNAEFRHVPALPQFGRGWLVVLRILLTALGALIMVVGANATWLSGVKGVDLTYEMYVERVFGGDIPSPPSGLNTFFVSLGLVPIVLAVFALLGLAGRSGLLTRLAAGLALLLMVAFAVTVATSDASLGGGVYVVMAGAVIALIGGVVAIAGKA